MPIYLRSSGGAEFCCQIALQKKCCDCVCESRVIFWWDQKSRSAMFNYLGDTTNSGRDDWTS